MGMLKSIFMAILSFIVFTTLPLAITSYFFLQEMDMSGIGGDIGGTILNTVLQNTGMMDQLSQQLAESLPQLQAICSMYPSWTITDIFSNMTGPGMPGYDEGGADALIGSIIPCFDIQCSEITTMNVAQLTERFTQDLSECDIELPAEFIQNLNISDFGGVDFGGFDFGGILGQMTSLTSLLQKLIVYMIIAGVICAILLLVISRDIGYFSRRMGMIFLITGISFIVLTYLMQALLPRILGNMFGGMGDTVSSIVQSIVFDPLDRLMTINIIYCVGGGAGVVIGSILQKRKSADGEFKSADTEFETK
jgi:hypothetical protein